MPVEKSKFKRIQKLRQKALQTEKKLNKLEAKLDFIFDTGGDGFNAVQDECKKVEDEWIKIIKQLKIKSFFRR